MEEKYDAFRTFSWNSLVAADADAAGRVITRLICCGTIRVKLDEPHRPNSRRKGMGLNVRRTWETIARLYHANGDPPCNARRGRGRKEDVAAEEGGRTRALAADALLAGDPATGRNWLKRSTHLEGRSGPENLGD